MSYVPTLVWLLWSCPKWIELASAARLVGLLEKVLIQLSLRYKTNDHFWFSFFHEPGHILKHSKKQMFVSTGDEGNNQVEAEANQFARDTLIPP